MKDTEEKPRQLQKDLLLNKVGIMSISFPYFLFFSRADIHCLLASRLNENYHPLVFGRDFKWQQEADNYIKNSPEFV